MAKRFQFRLKGLYKYRQHKTTEAKNALGEIAQLRMLKENEISTRKGYLESLMVVQRSIKVSELQAHSAHISSVKEEIIRLERELVSLEEIEAMRRNHLTRTMRDEKVIEKLHDRKLAEHRDTVQREDQALMDEIALRVGSVLE